MKDLKEYLLKESMSKEDEYAIEQCVRKLAKVGGVDKFEDKVFKGDDMDQRLIDILEKYDPYMEDVMWIAIENDKTPADTARAIRNMAEENEQSTGTEAHFALEFLEELISYLKL